MQVSKMNFEKKKCINYDFNVMGVKIVQKSWEKRVPSSKSSYEMIDTTFSFSE